MLYYMPSIVSTFDKQLVIMFMLLWILISDFNSKQPKKIV